MAFDGLFTHSIVHELNETLKNGRVSKIHQPYDKEVILRIRSNRKNYDLLLSAHSQYSRVQITEIPYTNPKEPPHFCMILRKYLESAFLNEIKQVENDRIIEFHFSSRDELGDLQDIILVVEIMGRHANIILVNQSTNRIIDTIKHVPASQNTYRTLLPGFEYIPAPEQDSYNPLTFDGTFKLQGNNTKEKTKHIQSFFQGFSRDSAKELLYQIDKHQDDSHQAVFEKFIQPFKQDNYSPTLTRGEKYSFQAVNFESKEGVKDQFESLSSLLDYFYYNKAERDRVNQQAHDLVSIVKNELNRNQNKLKKINKEADESEQADEYQVKGEILTAFMHEVQRGMDSITLQNFYDNNEPIEIELDSQKSPAENAQKYFSKYHKLKNRKAHLTKQISLTEEEISYLDSVLTQLENATTEDIQEVRQELVEEGYLKEKSKSKKKNTKSKASKPREFISSDGTLILVGRNNKQNDTLTMKTANKTDWWLHAQNIPGSHVIIREEDPSEQTFEEAAELAAYFSKYSQSSQVPVDTVQVKYVKKPNGAKPGLVIYEGQDTLFVTPDQEKVDKLAKQD